MIAMNRRLWLILLFVLGSLGFYNPHQIFSPQVLKLVYYLIFIICFISALRIKGRVNYQATPKIPYWFILIGISVATAFVPVYNEQSLAISIQASLPYLVSYSFLFILLAYNPPIEKVEKMLVYMGLLGIVVNAVNMVTAPNCFFGAEQEELDVSRGFVRVRTPIIYICFLFFYALSQFRNSTKKRKSWLFLTILAYAFIVFWVARQYIAYSAVLGLLLYLSQVKWYKKLLLALVCFLIFQYIVLEIPFVKDMIEMSSEQKDKSDEDVRTLAYSYYGDLGQTNDVTRIIGNGVPSFGNSQWAMGFEHNIEFLHVYTADVGWVGFYFYFGIFSLFGLVVLFIKGILLRHHAQYQYLNYLLLLFLLTDFAGGTILFSDETTALMLFFYLSFKTAKQKQQ